MYHILINGGFVILSDTKLNIQIDVKRDACIYTTKPKH